MRIGIRYYNIVFKEPLQSLCPGFHPQSTLNMAVDQPYVRIGLGTIISSLRNLSKAPKPDFPTDLKSAMRD